MNFDNTVVSSHEHYDDQPPQNQNALTLLELACLVGTSRQIIKELLEVELIEPCSREPEILFAVELLPRVRKIVRLHRHLDISLSSMALVLDLLDRIDDLEERLAEMESEESQR